MKKIILSKEFCRQFKVKVEKKDKDHIEISIDADFLIYLNDKETISASKFGTNKNNNFCDDTLVLKDILLDQIIYSDFIQKSIQPDGSEINFIEERFNIKEPKVEVVK